MSKVRDEDLPPDLRPIRRPESSLPLELPLEEMPYEPPPPVKRPPPDNSDSDPYMRRG